MLALSPDGRHLYTANRGSDYVAHTRAREVSILDLETLARVGVLFVGYGVDGMAYSPLSPP